MRGTPAAEAAIDVSLVASLLKDQFPHLANLQLQPIGNGWDNVVMRLGPELLVRLPRRRAAVPLVEHEQRWLPQLARRLPIAVPSPLHAGRPSTAFPWPWSISPWLPGQTADVASPDAGEAVALGRFLAALHQPAPTDAPCNPVRGVPLSLRAAAVKERIGRLQVRSALPRHVLSHAQDVWLRGLLAGPSRGAARWLHGDLHPGNVLTAQGRITGIIDWGDLCGGDVATDLAAFWMLFDARAIQQGLAAYARADAATIARAKGWAVFFGVTLLDAGLSDAPKHAAVGKRTLMRLAAASP